MDSEEMWMRYHSFRQVSKRSSKKSVKTLIKEASLVTDFIMNKPKGQLVSLPEKGRIE